MDAVGSKRRRADREDGEDEEKAAKRPRGSSAEPPDLEDLMPWLAAACAAVPDEADDEFRAGVVRAILSTEVPEGVDPAPTLAALRALESDRFDWLRVLRAQCPFVSMQGADRELARSLADVLQLPARGKVARLFPPPAVTEKNVMTRCIEEDDAAGVEAVARDGVAPKRRRAHWVGYACKRGAIAVLQFFAAIGTKRNIRCWDEARVAIAAEHDQRDVLRWMAAAGGPDVTNNARACAVAARAGNTDLLAWLRASPSPFAWNETVCAIAAERADVPMLQWLRERDCPWDTRVCAHAARAGNSDMLRWAHERGCPLDSETCAASAENGHLAVLQWLRSRDPPCPWDFMTCMKAARGGHLPILQWVRAHDPPRNWSAFLCREAAGGGHLPVLQWARAQEPPCRWEDTACNRAAFGGHTAVLQWMRAQEPPCPWGVRTSSAAAGGGHLETLQYLVDAGCPWNPLFCLNEMRIEPPRRMREVVAWINAHAEVVGA